LSVGRLLEILISQKNARNFRRALLRWYRRHGRDLPWRCTRDPYAILVSEFMLQQTQVATVLPYHKEWLCRFPTFAALARASESDVLHAWQGLGYYARARNLHAAAKLVVHRHKGRFPREAAAVRELPGVGRYTANAIVTFAFDQSVPIVEANTARLLSRLFNITTAIDSAAGRDQLWDCVTRLVPKNGAAAFNSALIDLGALICLPRAPKCKICPVKKFCRVIDPEILPVRKARPGIRHLTENHAFTVRQKQILLEQSTKRWRGMWILPLLKTRSTSTHAIHLSIFPFTHHRVTLKIFPRHPRKIDKHAQRWFTLRELKSIPIPSPHRRAIADLLSSSVSIGG
jgi:A/G-specific adenine glycosylase